jgi:tryptophan-rich sensory protein
MLNDNILDLTMGAVFWVVLTFSAAWAGARFMPDAWYARLNKPAWNPPEALFGPVWSALYFTMAVAAWLVWSRTGWEGFAGPLALYVLQLALNGMWTWLFFGRHRPDAALVDMGLLWITVAATGAAFWKVMPAAGILFIPYLAWISFAALLNFSIWKSNPRAA